MKNILFLLSITYLIIPFNDNQGNKIQETRQEDPRILKIRKWYGEIQKNLKNKAYNVKNEGDAALYFTKEDKRLVHVNVGVYNDGHEFIEEYYVKDNKIFFYYSQEISINESLPIPEGMSEQEAWETGAMYNAKNYNVEEKRIYFDKDKIIRYLTKEGIIDAGKNADKEMLKVNNKKEDVNSVKTTNYISRVNGYIKLLNKK